jgi:hypothetical protein
MTFWYAMNLLIPVAFLVGAGFYLDKAIKPEIPQQEESE